MIDKFEIVDGTDLSTKITFHVPAYGKVSDSSIHGIKWYDLNPFLVTKSEPAPSMKRELIDVPGRAPIDVSEYVFGHVSFDTNTITWTFRTRLADGLTFRTVNDGYRYKLHGKQIGIRFYDSQEDDIVTAKKQNAYWLGTCEVLKSEYSKTDKWVDTTFKMIAEPHRWFPPPNLSDDGGYVEYFTDNNGVATINCIEYTVKKWISIRVWGSGDYHTFYINDEPFTLPLDYKFHKVDMTLYPGIDYVLKNNGKSVHIKEQEGIF